MISKRDCECNCCIDVRPLQAFYLRFQISRASCANELFLCTHHSHFLFGASENLVQRVGEFVGESSVNRSCTSLKVSYNYSIKHFNQFTAHENDGNARIIGARVVDHNNVCRAGDRFSASCHYLVHRWNYAILEQVADLLLFAGVWTLHHFVQVRKSSKSLKLFSFNFCSSTASCRRRSSRPPASDRCRLSFSF